MVSKIYTRIQFTVKGRHVCEVLVSSPVIVVQRGVGAGRGRGGAAGRNKPPRYSNHSQTMASQQSQDMSGGTQPFSQSAITQGMSMSQGFQMSQPGLSGLSQPELSQVQHLRAFSCELNEEMKM